jgi:glycosyltransferase involved in cell wall biosynthesis
MVNKNIKISLSHPIGNPNAKSVLMGLQENNMLHSFHTSIACFPDNCFDKLSMFPLLKDFKRRSFDSNIRKQTYMYPYKELGRLFSQRLKLNSLLTHETGIFSSYKCCQYIDNKVDNFLQKHSDILGIYAYEDCAISQFSVAKQYGIKCIYDLPTGYWRASRKLLAGELDRYPEWSNTFVGFKDSDRKLAIKDMELNYADVVYVASKFTADTLKEYPGKLPTVKIIPYGFPPINTPKKREKKGKVKLLFVGNLSQQKGIADMFEAVKGLEKFVELTLIGKRSNNKILEKELKNNNYLNVLPQYEVLKIMREQDILLFPSLFDGFGMVITEAMSQGTPVIASERSAGPDLITHGENGWLMKAGSFISLRENIENILTNPHIIEEVGFRAIETAKNRPWSKYGEETAQSIMELNYR